MIEEEGAYSPPPPLRQAVYRFRLGHMRNRLANLLVIVSWSCSVVYLYAGESFGGFGYQNDYRLVALTSLILSTFSMMDRSFIQQLIGFRNGLRMQDSLTDCS